MYVQQTSFLTLLELERNCYQFH